MSKLAVIVDGGFIRAKLYIPQDPDNPDQPYGYPDANTLYQKILSVVERNFNDDELFRIFFYDCIPDPHDSNTYRSPVSEDQVGLLSNIQVENQIRIFNKLKNKPFIAFRYGELAFDGWKIRNVREFRDKVNRNEAISNDDFNIRVTQKGIDLKIGLDIAWLAMNCIVDKILLIAGDSDLVPAMKFARKEGLMVYLETLGHGVKKSMFEHSDRAFRSRT